MNLRIFSLSGNGTEPKEAIINVDKIVSLVEDPSTKTVTIHCTDNSHFHSDKSLEELKVILGLKPKSTGGGFRIPSGTQV